MKTGKRHIDLNPKKKFDPRRMMEKAIEVMKQSVTEHRPDGTPSPFVGAVLVRPDGSIETAARGELREGNHAEYILIERKCFGERLDGSILFTTLEPCLERSDPKRGCAKHIVSARIREVYVGIEDDNPVVGGKGIEYLKRCGVNVEMFDRDLQEEILKENKTFFEWARQQSEKSEPEPIKLSTYEDTITAVTRNDFSIEALEHYRLKANISTTVDSDSFTRMLLQQGLLTEVDGVITPTGFGFLLFGKEPRNAIPQSGLLARAEFADGSTSRMEFGQPMVLIPRLIEEWLNKVLPSTIDRSEMERRERVNLPFEMIREAVVNALIHRDYNMVGQKCQLVLNADMITIKSPGAPISPITLQQMNSFSAPMKSRNPVLHYVFARMGLAEEQGFGLLSLKKHAEKLNLPLPRYTMEADALVLTIYRAIESATKGLDQSILKELTSEEQRGWAFLATKTTTNQSEYARNMRVTARTAQRHLSHFVLLGLLRRVGRGPATKYVKL